MDARDWIGRSETKSDTVTPAPYAALSATLDWPVTRPPAGTPIPPLWHWLYFLPCPPQAEIGPDGHAARGGFLPPIPLPRRMWAGSELDFHAPIAIGDAITRSSVIESITEKAGRSGRLVFVRVRHAIRRQGEPDPVLTEFHDVVYREAARPEDAAATPKPAPASSRWERRIVPDPVLLFRYSALTFNGHRIHYDRRYVTEVEGYPGLVVHGPLIATLLLDLLRRELPDARVARFEFRAMRPLYDLDAFHVCGDPAEGGRTVHLWARDPGGSVAMDGTATIA